jgi:hypothetical protein
MTELVKLIRKQVADGLIIYLSHVKNKSQEAKPGEIPRYVVGDSIEFDVMLKNKNPFPLGKLNISIHQVDAVKFNESPIAGQIQNLASGAEEKVATVRGLVIANPDDAKSAWRFLDNVCRITVNGEVDLPPITFHDEEFEIAHIEDA